MGCFLFLSFLPFFFFCVGACASVFLFCVCMCGVVGVGGYFIALYDLWAY